MQKKWFTFSNITTAILIIFIIAMFINPNVKAFLLKGLMSVGLFKPSLPEIENKSISVSYNEALKDLELKTENGEIITSETLKEKVVFINLWATWCPPCIAEMPSINKLYEKLKNNKQVVFLMIDADNNPEKSIKFMKEKNFDLPVTFLKSSLPAEINSSTLPTTFILNKNGNVVFKHTGVANYNSKKFENFINQLLNQ